MKHEQIELREQIHSCVYFNENIFAQFFFMQFLCWNNYRLKVYVHNVVRIMQIFWKTFFFVKFVQN